MSYGCTGKILRVNLSDGKIWTEEPGELFYRRYLGGGGVAAYYLLKELPKDVDPLGPENLLIFAPGVLTGAPAPGCSRFTVAAKSPLSESYGETEAGGWWGPELKFAGFDAVVIQGRAEKPVYLWVHDGEVEIRDAGKIWGKVTGEAEAAIREELGDPRIRVAQIGPGGEKQVRFACVINELKHANGRTGMGAVMGSKNLKAIAARGKQRVAMHDEEGARAVVRWIREHYEYQPGDMHDLGTDGGLLGLDEGGILPTRNFLDGAFEGAQDITGQTMKDTILTNRGTCYACPVACKRVVEVEEPYQVDPSYGGPEYETCASLGSCCGVRDLKAISKGNELCNKYSLDTISTGTTIAFAMECYENGILTKEDTGGIDLSFGNGEAMVKMVEMIGERRGLGDVLAEGVMRAAQKIGKGAERYAMHVKGQELPMHEPRGKRSLALAYATSPTGACHVEADHDTDFEVADAGALVGLSSLGLHEPVSSLDLGPKKVRIFFYSQQVWDLCNAIGLCIFVAAPIGPFPLDKLVEYTRGVTGWDTSLWELLKVGERAGTMFRLFNQREGFSRKDDTLPDRMFEGLRNGKLEGEKLDREEFERALTLYYQMAGWDEQGVPTKARLAELELEWATPAE